VPWKCIDAQVMVFKKVMASTPLSHRLPGADSTFEIIRYEKLYESTHSAAGVEAAICAFQNVHTNLELRIEEHQNGQGAKSHKETIACEAGVL